MTAWRDLGAASSQTQGVLAAFAPRAALVYAPTADRKRSSRRRWPVYDRVPLALDFVDNPAVSAASTTRLGALTSS
jgi:hypothetical protein